jgi:hypothetical protein
MDRDSCRNSVKPVISLFNCDLGAKESHGISWNLHRDSRLKRLVDVVNAIIITLDCTRMFSSMFKVMLPTRISARLYD